MTSYRRNPRLVPRWDTDGNGTRVELVDTRSGRVFRVEPSVLGLLNRMPDFVPVREVTLDGHDGDSLASLVARMATAGLVESREAGDLADPGDGTAPGPYAGPFADRGEWSACELAVHAQSALGGKARMRLADIPPGRLTHPEALATIPLPSCGEPSRPLTEVLAARRSIRDFATAALPLDRLSVFLERAARVRGWLGPQAIQATRRPSASGGGRHSLELYLLVRNAERLDAGAYHYDPFDHTLSYLEPWTDEHDQLQRRLLCAPMGVDTPPAVSIYLASYFRRDQCKYGGMTLSLIYRDTGCLLQTLYLVATDLGLAGCATAAMEAAPSPSFLRGNRDMFIHTGNFAVALPADDEPANPPLRPI